MTIYQITSSGEISRLTDSAYIPADLANSDYAAYLAWIAAGNTPLPPPVPTLAERQSLIVATVQRRLDSAAQTRGYDDILSAITYADDPTVPRFQADGLAFRTLRSATWATCYQIQAQIASGAIPVPTDAEFLALLPPLPVFKD